MDSFINRLRNKSDEEKKQWVKIFAIVATALVILLWILLRYVIFAPEKKETSSEPSVSQDVEDLYQESSEQFNSLRNNFDKAPVFFPDYSVPEDETSISTETEIQETESTEFFNS